MPNQFHVRKSEGELWGTSIEELRAEWEYQEAHPLTEPCPRCGTTHNHAVNIDVVLNDAVQKLSDSIDQQALEAVLKKFDAR